MLIAFVPISVAQSAFVCGEPVLGTPDLQSLADLANSYEVVRTMRVVPFEPRLLLSLAAVIAVPVVPLALTMMPLEELVRGIMKLLL